MLSTQATASIRAMVMKNRAARRQHRGQRVVYVDGGAVFHRSETKKPVSVSIKRAIRVDRSAYTGDIMREISRQNGSGKGLRQLAVKQATRALRISGDLRPAWMRHAEDVPHDLKIAAE